ncbi:sensor histidine kinase [Labedaea rhizosphaerae]|uniref:Signal transduction histidine kinase n=1 Tax=Labedaea rhizosphaerae TaxID=598644 RepID=A0A4R6S759_LABRH|nr:ATP-binding protein [Labedaea rhizosphaerae]TDP95057.1 signal transduction histidine kinase [Labedaea rhizosphaerae]
MGPAERLLLRQGLKYALILRLIVSGVASLVSLVLEPGPVWWRTAAVVLGLNAWQLWFARERLRTCTEDGGTSRRWLVPLDVAVICAICLSQTWTTVLPHTSEDGALLNWVQVAAEIAVVAYPWVTGPLGLALLTAAVTAAYIAGQTMAQPELFLGGAALHLWLIVEAALSWGIYRLVRGRARTADEQVAREERLRTRTALANARRVDENEYLATLHDTASATLLMVGAGVVAGRQEWLAEQAARDLEAIRGPAAVPGSEVDLVPMLREVVRQSPLRVRWHGVESLRVPALDAVMLCHGTREALTNVLRHAGTDEATTTVAVEGGDVVIEVTDHGRGFDPASISGHHHGVTRSLVARMARIGGNATVTSKPGVGTTVRMTWPLSHGTHGQSSHSSGPIRLTDPIDTEIIAANYGKGLRWSVVGMSAIILLLLDVPKLLANLDAYDSVVAQVVALAGFLGITVVAGISTQRDRPLGGWRWPLLALALGLSVLATQAVSAEHRLGVAHWAEGDAAWWVALLLLDSPVAVFVSAVVAQYVLTYADSLIFGHAAVTVAGTVNAVLLVLSFQFAVGMIAAVLRSIAAPAARAAREAEQLRTAEAVERALHEDRKERWAALADTTVPLLDGLASGRLDPADDAVRRACAVEATRMRRLFVEAAGEADPLLHELRACIELAERNGVSVSFAEYGNRPKVPIQARRMLTEPAVAVLATARGKVRLTMVGTVGTDGGDGTDGAQESVTVSVVAARTPYAVPAPDRDGVRTAVVEEGDRLWIQTTWRGGT